jgi:hypothetical protein
MRQKNRYYLVSCHLITFNQVRSTLHITGATQSEHDCFYLLFTVGKSCIGPGWDVLILGEKNKMPPSFFFFQKKHVLVVIAVANSQRVKFTAIATGRTSLRRYFFIEKNHNLVINTSLQLVSNHAHIGKHLRIQILRKYQKACFNKFSYSTFTMQ